MTSPLDAFFTVCRQASDAALLRSKATSEEQATDREGNLLDQYLKAEQAFMDVLEACQVATGSTRVDEALAELRAAIRGNSPKLVWRVECDDMGAEAGLFYNGMEDRR